MKPKLIVLALTAAVAATLLVQEGDAQKPSAPTKPKLALSIKPRHVTDALRAVIQSDREIYTQVAADHAPAAAQSNPEKELPSPCEILRLGSQSVASKGVEYSYVLRALKPINSRNIPETDVETKGLQFVATRPDLAYTAEELLGGRWYFTAVYPDVAVNRSCVDCHNRQPGQPGTFKLGDVLGGLVVRIALEL